MKRYTQMILIAIALVAVLLVAGFFFVYRPTGLGPEPAVVLSPDFFDTPASSLDALDLMVGGQDAFAEILSAIEEARQSIYVQTYIWKDDQIGRLVVDKLKDAAARGVAVTIHKDVLGTFFELGDTLKGKPSPVYTRAGLRGIENISVATDLFEDTDHSKYFIFDGKVTIFGGMNIADEYHMQWHDYMAAIKSETWTAAFEQKAIHSAPWPAEAPFVVAVNDRKSTEIRTALLQIIDHAAKQIIVEHAYFSDDKIIEALKGAADRGVEVAVILPKHPDTHIYANRVTINRLLGSGKKRPPKIFLYPRMSHAKVVMTDGVIVAVGSANLTPRSMVTSRELTLFVHGKQNDPFIEQMRDQLAENIRQSERVGKPFELSAAERIMAVAGKYTW